jgi:hypothetical protein
LPRRVASNPVERPVHGDQSPVHGPFRFFMHCRKQVKDGSYKKTIQATCGSEQITRCAARTMRSYANRSNIMNRHTFRSSIFITAMLAASAAFAGADIVKCVDQNGKVTLTDAQCGEGLPTMLVQAEAAPAPLSVNESAEGAVPAAAPAVRRVATQRVAYAPQPIQHDSWTAPRPSKMLSRDVETLKAARLSMQVLDEASATVRHQRLAGLN